MKYFDISIGTDQLFNDVSAKDVVGCFDSKELLDEMCIDDIVENREEAILDAMNPDLIVAWYKAWTEGE